MGNQRKSFDAVAHQVEAKRHLVANTEFESEAQVEALAELEKTLQLVELQSSDLRQALLTGADPIGIEMLVEQRDISIKAAKELADMEAKLRINPENIPRDPNRIRCEFPEDDLEGGAASPAIPRRPIPVMSGGAARTFEEAEQPHRNP